MRRLIGGLLLFSLSWQLSASEELSITVEELVLLLQLSGNSKVLDENLSALLNGIREMQPREELLLNDFDGTLVSLNESVTDSEKSSSDARSISQDLNSTVTTVVQTTSELKPSFWKSPVGTGLIIIGVVLISFGAGWGVGQLPVCK